MYDIKPELKTVKISVIDHDNHTSPVLQCFFINFVVISSFSKLQFSFYFLLRVSLTCSSDSLCVFFLLHQTPMKGMLKIFSLQSLNYYIYLIIIIVYNVELIYIYFSLKHLYIKKFVVCRYYVKQVK